MAIRPGFTKEDHARVIANARRAIGIRDRLLRVTERVLDDLECLPEGSDGRRELVEAVKYINTDVRSLVRDSELAAGVGRPEPETTQPTAVDPSQLDPRATALAVLELMRRGVAASAQGDIVDAEVADDDDED